MSSVSNKPELDQIRKKIILLQIIDFPAAVMLGLGLYARFGADGNAFIDLLNNRNIVDTLIGVGGMMMFWVLLKMIPLFIRKSEITNCQEN